MDSETTAAERFAIWADLVSLLLVGASMAIGGVTPVYYAFGRTRLHRVLLVVSMTLTIVFSAARFIVEGIFVAPGPREFLLASVIYITRWFYFLVLLKSNMKFQHGFLVARALLNLRHVRFGRSTQHSRRGSKEVVIRRGSFGVKGEVYWRGVVESVRRCGGPDNEVFVVRLVEEGLHSESLKNLGVVAYKQESNYLGREELYRLIYNLVMAVDTLNPNFVVDYTPFLRQFDPVSAHSLMSRRTGCDDVSDLGDMARRVAADAVYFIGRPSGLAELRTPAQVTVINECIEKSVQDYLDKLENGSNVDTSVEMDTTEN